MKQKSKSAKQVEEADSDLEDDDMGDLDDDEVSLGSLDEEDFEEGVGEDGGMFMDELNDSEEVNSVSAIKKCKTSGKRKKDIDFAKFISGKKPKKGVKDDVNMAAAAEEFGYLLDENAGSKFDNIGINAMANKDKASIKQLQWEAERDAWIRGKDARTLRKQKNKFKARKLQNKHKRFLKEKR